MIAGYIVAGCIAAWPGIAQAASSTSPYALLDSVNTNFTFTDCAAPETMQSCWLAQNITDDSDYDTACSGIEKRVECALEYCWNRVYSCDYQQLIVQYNFTCTEEDALDTPFFPAPANAAGACSCNLGSYLNAIEGVETSFYKCTTAYQKGQGGEDYSYGIPDEPNMPCDCCQYGAVASAMHDICPSTDPNILRLDVFSEWITESNGTVSECPSYLQNFTCTGNSFGTYGSNASAYAQATLPASGTGSLTDASGSITSPVSGATYTWTAKNATYTITAASVAAVATRTGSASGAASMSGTATASGPTSSTSSSSSNSQRLNHDQNSIVAFIGFAGLAFAMLQ